MEKLQIRAEELFLKADDLINRFIEKQSGDLISLEGEINRIVAAFDDAIERTMAIDQSLKGAFESERVRVIKSLEQLEDRLRKAAKRKDETSVFQIKALSEKLFPEKTLQERHDNFMTLYSRFGRQFLEELKSHLDPFEQKFTVLVEE